MLHDIEPIRFNVPRIAQPSVEFLSLEDKNPDYAFVEPASEAEQPVPVPSDAASRADQQGIHFQQVQTWSMKHHHRQTLFVSLRCWVYQKKVCLVM